MLPGPRLAVPRVLLDLPEGLHAEHRRRPEARCDDAFGEAEGRGGGERRGEVEGVDVRDSHLGDVGKYSIAPVPGGPIRNGVVEDELELAVEGRLQPQGVKPRGRVRIRAPRDEGVEAREVHAGEPRVRGGIETLP